MVWASQPVSMLATGSPFIVEANTPAGLAAGTAATKNPAALCEGLIVMREGVYLGLVSPAALSATIAKENAMRARTLGQAARRMEAARAKLNSAAREKADFLAFLAAPPLSAC